MVSKILLSAIILLTAASVSATNPCAISLSQRLFKTAGEEMIAGHWKKARELLQKSYFLNPDFEVAARKEKQLTSYLRYQSDSENRLGEAAYQSLEWDSARFHWVRASHFLPEEESPLSASIKKNLKKFKIEAKPSLATTKVEDGFHQKRVAMEDVKNFLEEGNASQAQMTLNELIYRDPDDQRAKMVLGRLNTKSATTEEHSLSENIESKFAEGEKYFQQGKQTKNRLERYSLLKSGFHLFQPDDLKPPYYKELAADHEKLEKELTTEFQSRIAAWKKQVARGENLRNIGERLQIEKKQYPALPEANELLVKVYQKIAEATESSLMRAKTIHELSGCQAALSQYQAVQREAYFREVATWQEAEKNILGCSVGDSLKGLPE